MIEYGGGWVHWHQPHTWSEITRAGLAVALSGDPDVAAWYVGSERRTATIAERDEIARRGPLFEVVNEDRRADEPLVEFSDHFGVGEQTCSQVGAARSTTLILEGAPRDDREDRLRLLSGQRLHRVDGPPVDLEELEEHFGQLAVGLGGGD